MIRRKKYVIRLTEERLKSAVFFRECCEINDYTKI